MCRHQRNIHIEGYRGDKTIDEVLKFIGDESSDNKKNKDCKIKNKIKSGNEKGNDCDRPKNGEMKMSNYNSVEEVYTTVFQPIDSLDDESKLIKSSKKGKKKYQNKTNLLRNLHLPNRHLMSDINCLNLSQSGFLFKSLCVDSVCVCVCVLKMRQLIFSLANDPNLIRIGVLD